ncbi:Cyclin-dependent protein kinase inhibitor SMR6, partial [Mucuna pruriens]
MGFSHSDLESESKKWVIAGIAVRSLKPINTKRSDEEEELSTTPTAKEARIPDKLPCPPAPRKRRPSRCGNNLAGGREFFTPPDLETVFKCHVKEQELVYKIIFLRKSHQKREI